MIFTGKYATGICPSRNKSVQDTFLMKNSKIVWDGGIMRDYFPHYNLFGSIGSCFLSRVLYLGVQWCVHMTFWYGIFKQKKSEQWGKRHLLCRCNRGYGSEFLHCVFEKRNTRVFFVLQFFHSGHSWSCSPVQALFQSSHDIRSYLRPAVWVAPLDVSS